MTREEEIITASHNEKNYPCCIISDKTSHPIIFQIGAKWADQHPKKGLWNSEKVIEWLRANIHDYYEVNEFQEWFDSMYKDLKEAMEE